MVIYELKATSVNMVCAIFWLFLVVFLFVCIIICMPLLKKVVEMTGVLIARKMETFFSVKQFSILIVLTLLIYGLCFSGVVIGTINAVANLAQYSASRNTCTISGKVQKYTYEEIEHRGEVAGYSLMIDLDGKQYCIQDPPGVDDSLLKTITEGSEVSLCYYKYQGVFIITKIEVFT